MSEDLPLETTAEEVQARVDSMSTPLDNLAASRERLRRYGVTANRKPAPLADLPHERAMSSVMILDALMPAFEEWLHSRGCFLAKFPGGDDADFVEYTVGVGDALMGRSS